MSEKKYVKHYGDLIVYQKAREIALRIFKITAEFPKEEMYALTDHERVFGPGPCC